MQETPDLPPGTRFGGDFTILRPIGAGGMASVFEAREEPLGRVVALKILGRAAEPALRARFLAEARAMASLRHPNVAEVHRCGTDAATGLPFLAMDRFPGSLADRLTDSRVLPEDEAAAVGLALADALAALHGREPPLVHRDVKPSNVLLAADGRPVLADFGLAKALAPDATALTSPGAGQPGTWLYAAPEQRAGAEPSPAMDWYALGVLLYRCLSGGFPGPGGELPRDIAAGVSRRWRPLLRALLRADPAARLADADAIRGALRRIRRACRRRALLRRIRRPAFFALAALAAAALLAVVAAACIRAGRESARAAAARERALLDAIGNEERPLERLRSFLDAAMRDPAPGADGRIRVPAGAVLFAEDVEGLASPVVLLDGGTLFFGQRKDSLEALAASWRDRADRLRSGGDPSAVLPRADVPEPERGPRVFPWPILVGEGGGSLVAYDEGNDLSFRVTNAVRRAPGVESATLRCDGFSNLILDRSGLDPGLTVGGCGSVADVLPGGRLRDRRWFDGEEPL